MAVKRIIQYRGRTVRIWEKSYRIDRQPLVFVGETPDLDDIRDAIDRQINLAKYRNLKPPIGRRIADWFELKAGFGGDLHRQVWYAWRDYPDAMRMSLIVGFLVGCLLMTVALIVGEWALR